MTKSSVSGSSGLITCRARADNYVLSGLRIFVPRGRARTTANRLAWLNPRVLRAELVEFGDAGNVERFDQQDYGNLATELRPCLPETVPEEPVAGWVRELLSFEGVDAVGRPDGLLGLRVRGTAFATAGRGVMTYGLGSQTPVGPPRCRICPPAGARARPIPLSQPGRYPQSALP